jgi:hypothetical protein
MQLLLSFATDPPNETELTPDLWSTLPSQVRGEALGALARLLAKTAAQSTTEEETEQRREPGDD